MAYGVSKLKFGMKFLLHCPISIMEQLWILISADKVIWQSITYNTL